jgi:hypothetical protein
MIQLNLSLQTVSEANRREHWASRARRVKMQRAVVTMALRQYGHLLPELRDAEIVRVLLVRVSPRRLDDDNLRGALKAVRDAVAAWVGIDDGSPRWEWNYDQRKGPLGVSLAIGMPKNSQG